LANENPNIRPGGLNQKELVDLLYMIVNSLQGVCSKLDSDSKVPLETYTTNCYTNIFTVKIEDSKGNVTGNNGNEAYSISPTGISDKALLQLMYEITDCVETLTEQLDTDVLTDSDYENDVYLGDLSDNNGFVHYIVHQNTGSSVTQLGNSVFGTTFREYYFNSGGLRNHYYLIDWLYNCVNAIETLTEKLDGDATVNDTNYEALHFTATILVRIEDSKGNQIGVTRSLN
jgi:hypothetical protein